MKTEVAMELHLEKKEASLAFRILENRVRELRTEVRHDKDSSVRDYLKNEERILKNILAKFSVLEEEKQLKSSVN
jgi:DNA integrity scanning protein DisA with diadenylate cyclase activity